MGDAFIASLLRGDRHPINPKTLPRWQGSARLYGQNAGWVAGQRLRGISKGCQPSPSAANAQTSSARRATWASLHARLRAIPGIWKSNPEGLRRFVEAAIVILRTGVAWEDLPERCGKPNSVYRRFRGWSQRGIWDALFEDGVLEDALETVMVDATIAKAQRFASGARGGGEEEGPRPVARRPDDQDPRLGRPLWPAVVLPADAGPGRGLPPRHAETLFEGGSFACLIGDRAYDTDALRAWCAEHGVEAVIPSKRNRKVPVPHDRARYRTRHRIESLFCRVKDYTRIVLRKDKTSRSYAGFVSLAFALINLQLRP